MRKLTRFFALFLVLLVLTAAAAGCNNTKEAEAKEIYFLNFKPEVSEYYKEVADKYEEETGVKVKVETAASGEYETTLTSEISKTNPPTIFQINGPVGYENWKDYCADLSNSSLYNALNDYGKSLVVKSGSGIYGIPYAIEGYGIIVNEDIMNKYFSLPGKSSDTVGSLEEINNFEKLKAVVEDMTKLKAELGIEGVFASTSMSEGNQWRWQTHLLNIPMYYEFKEKGGTSTVDTGLAAKEIEFKYAENYKNLFDLYIDNSVTDKNLLSSKSVDDAMAEFALGKAAMVQNGMWAYDQIAKTAGNVVKNFKYLPLYMGIPGEESQGLALGTENYLAINSQADEAEQKASIDFLTWLFTSDYGKEQIAKKFKFSAPFKALEGVAVDNPLIDQLSVWSAKPGMEQTEWTFNSFPSEEFKKKVGAALLEYAQGQKTWDEVTNETKEAWKTEQEAKQ